VTVFISYQRVDESKARSIGEKLNAFGVRTYIDVMDPYLSSTEDVTNLILGRLHTCTHLMAVVSSHTVASWWVPFEIGVATEGDRRITSYRRDTVTLPDFLKIWPVLNYDYQLERFAQRYFQDSAHGETSYRFAGTSQKSLHRAAQFHDALKGDLGQR